MIVVDSSAWVDLATNGGSTRLYDALGSSGHWVVPQHFRPEAMNAVRGLWLGRYLSDGEFEEAVEQLGTADLDEWSTVSLIPRIRELAAEADTSPPRARAEPFRLSGADGLHVIAGQQ